MWRYSCVAVLLPALLMFWCGSADSMPLFGLISLFGGTNRTSLAQTLLLNHVQHKIDTLGTLANFITVTGNATG